MIGQCLSNKNESATVSKTKKILKLNKAQLSISTPNFSALGKNNPWKYPHADPPNIMVKEH